MEKFQKTSKQLICYILEGHLQTFLLKNSFITHEVFRYQDVLNLSQSESNN